MRRLNLFWLMYPIFAALAVQGQNDESGNRSGQAACPVATPATLIQKGKLNAQNEVLYRSPIRYLIVYNDIGPTDDRRIEVLMNAQNINEKDLKTVFCWIAERFPLPVALTIDVHTNLATIETPDERDLLRDGSDSRFSKFYTLYKRADYARFESGRQAFGYTTHLSPYRKREVVIKDGR